LNDLVDHIRHNYVMDNLIKWKIISFNL
jgi:hypothetical protein